MWIWMLQPLKRCHTLIISREGKRRKVASMLLCSRCAAVAVAMRLASVVWTFSVVTAPNLFM
ncbi:hypothetical protein RHMOL_Rhmol12G0230300 [Rhododendron molle]|uniref:Uncharacterized protein n=1 Tax=Rhododendron molle TaxID=49168 RepID=A0ACC0LL80_RHOML|nr:hypothetical protein RHMOL_Rhmol12G0230300 [Rhododendron molle]